MLLYLLNVKAVKKLFNREQQVHKDTRTLFFIHSFYRESIIRKRPEPRRHKKGTLRKPLKEMGRREPPTPSNQAHINKK